MLPLREKATLPPGFIKTRNHQHSTGFLGFSLYKPTTKRTEYDNTTYSSTEQTTSCTCLVLHSPTMFTIGSIHWPTKVQSLGNGPLYHCVPSLCFHCLSFPFSGFWAILFTSSTSDIVAVQCETGQWEGTPFVVSSTFPATPSLPPSPSRLSAARTGYFLLYLPGNGLQVKFSLVATLLPEDGGLTVYLSQEVTQE